MKVKFRIPQTINDIELGEFQEYHKVLEANKGQEDDNFVLMKMLSIFCDVPMDELRKLNLAAFDLACAELSKALSQDGKFRNVINVGGAEFGFIPNLDEITAGEYIDLEKYLASVSDYHKAMAVMYRPITMRVHDTYEIEPYKPGANEDLMRSAGLGDTMGAVLFFWTLGNELVKLTLNSLAEELRTMDMESERNLERSGAGINRSTILQMVTSLESTLSQPYPFTKYFSNLHTTRTSQELKAEK